MELCLLLSAERVFVKARTGSPWKQSLPACVFLPPGKHQESQGSLFHSLKEGKVCFAFD